MLVRPVHQEWELWKWLAIISLAAALSLALASAIGAADRGNPDRPPELLPAEIQEWATPMPGENAVTPSQANDLGREIWEILELHRARNHEAAMSAWQGLLVPPETAVWKWIALGQASIATEKFEQAEDFLGRAIDLQPENALAYYFRGILRMHQARLAWDWPEEFGLHGTRLIAFTPRRIVPNTKSMYELAATADLEKAIELARHLNLDEAIVPDRFPTQAALEPAVGDLLLALNAEKFVAKAHNTLGSLFLKRGALELAEQHMDDAVHGGLAVVYGYRELGDEYRACGRHADAMRAYLKAATYTPHKVTTLLDAFRSLQDVFTGQ